MEKDEEIYLPPLRWWRPSSTVCNIWIVHGGNYIVAVVDEFCQYARTWSFLWLVSDEWVDLVEFGAQSSPIGGIVPHFGDIVEYVLPVDRSVPCLLIVESEGGSIWWLVYGRLRLGGYILLCIFHSRYSDLETEILGSSSEEDSDELESSQFVRWVFDA
jgi:hypothetical protein